MKVLWAKPNSTAAEVTRLLSMAGGACHPKTVKTHLRRLLTKRVLDFRKEERTYLYRPVMSEAECVDVACNCFLRQVFNGSFVAMVGFFVENEKLSPSQLQALSQYLVAKAPSLSSEVESTSIRL